MNFIRLLQYPLAGLLFYACSHSSPTIAEPSGPGSVGEECGGLEKGECGAGLFCEYTDFTCGRKESSGRCQKPAQICSEIYSPVCGCDGKTYSNSCKAKSAKQSVAGEGGCISETR